jgi:hypothetical protein
MTGVLPDDWLRYYEACRAGHLATPPGHRPAQLISYDMYCRVFPRAEHEREAGS